MVRALLSPAVLLIVALAPVRAHAQVGNLPNLPDCGDPQATVLALLFVENECVDLSEGLVFEGKLWRLSLTSLEVGPALIQSLHAALNPDPFISFGMTTMNLVPGPVTYALFLGTTIVPDFYRAALSTANVSVTSGESGMATVDVSAIYPTYVSGYGTVGAAMTNLGVDLGSDPCTAGSGAPTPTTETCDYGMATNTFPPTFYDNLEALLTYTQTDRGSTASWSGSVVLDTVVVPEPSTVILLATGLLGLAGVAVRRRRMS